MVGRLTPVRVQFLGTGSADGWPNPWCHCASCGWARETGNLRGQTGVLIDDVILLDCGPDVPRAAARHGISLATVRRVLIGHAHPDHCGPQAFMWRNWSTQSAAPLEIIAPPAAVEACGDWVRPGGPVTFTAV